MMTNYKVPYLVGLQDLMPGIVLENSPNVFGLEVDSRLVQQGDVFLAYPGLRNDGRDYIDQAIANGATVVLYEKSGADIFLQDDCAEVNQRQALLVAVENLAQQVGTISARYFHQPAQQLVCMGVTGTNGKTSCAYWLAQLLHKMGKTVGLIGTLGNGVWNGSGPVTLKETGYTTPDAIQVQKTLYDFKERGVSHAVMEVSSHSLDQGRVRAVPFSAALFTNISRDHLDYHGSMEAYADAKAKLFLLPELKHAVLNLDDPATQGFINQIKSQESAPQIITYSVEDVRADVYLQHSKISLNGVRAVLCSPWGEEALEAPVIGEFNVANLLGVITTLCAEGFALKAVLNAVTALQTPVGRMQRVTKASYPVQVFVDYAHTPDALENVLSTLRNCGDGKLWCVFGCGGDRDAGKRPLMGEVVSRLADYCVVTSDNPRSEDAASIMKQVVVSMPSDKTTMMVDRSEAIQFAIQNAREGDIVLIAGKGHEQYQDIKGIKYPFDDVQQAQAVIGGFSKEGHL